MGVYGEQLLPRMINLACGVKQAHPYRRRACAGLAGDVVEIGFGSGLNVPFYPAAVTSVAAVEPSDVAWRLASKRVRAAHAEVRRAGLDGQSLPFSDDTFDAALSTWTMCTIPDVDKALAEVRRVLRPGGSCTSSSTDWRPTPVSPGGSTASNRCRCGSSAGAT